MTRRSILVIHSGGLGDVLLGLPALRALRAAYPADALGLLAGRAVGELLACCGEVDRVFPLEGTALTELLMGPQEMAPDLGAWLADCDLAVAWMNDPGGALAETFSASGVKRVVIHPASADSTERFGAGGHHQAERLLRTLPMEGQVSGQPLLLPDTLVAEGARLLTRLGVSPGDLVGIHPGSGSPHKCGTADLMRGVIDDVRAQGWTPVLLEGLADTSAVRAVLEACVNPPVVAAGMSLTSMAGLLANLQVFVGYDSGLSHLASFLGRPTVTLFGPTDPGRWAPCGNDVAILTGDSCHCQTWPDVKACREKRCLAVPVQDVLAAIQSLRGIVPHVDPQGVSLF